MSFTRLAFYSSLLAARETLLQAAEDAALAFEDDIDGVLGTSGAGSAFPGSMADDAIDAIAKVAREHVSPRTLSDELRKLVKSVYGDEYDVAATSSCEAALGVIYDALLTPPQLGRGDPYKVRCVGLIERHAEHHLSYGRPFPPHYKELFADRGAIAGELGITGRRQLNTEIVMVPMAGARYELHGPKMLPCPLLMGHNGHETIKAVEIAAERHSADLAGFLTLGYDTQGYGYAEKGPSGAPAVQIDMGRIARRYGVPYVVDNAWGVPFLGTDPRLIDADVITYSMDKVSGASTSGLIIGKEVPMVNVRRALGIQSERFGNPSAHGKGAHVSADPGKLSLASLVHALRQLRDHPRKHIVQVDETFAIVQDELPKYALPGIAVCKSYNLGGVELNYEANWEPGRGGIAIFSNEDRIANSQILAQMMLKMGVFVIQSEDGNILITPGLGTSYPDGRLNHKAMRKVVRSLLTVLRILFDWSQENRRVAAVD
jgi:hypothetical protein